MIAFGSRLVWNEAAKRIDGIEKNQGHDVQLEQAAALWQIAFELDRIADVLEEAHK